MSCKCRLVRIGDAFLDIAVDTSSLSNILNERTLRGRFVARLGTRRLVVPSEAAAEVLSQVDTARVVPRAAAMAELLDGTEWLVARHARGIVAAEVARLGGLRGIPAMHGEEVAPLVKLMRCVELGEVEAELRGKLGSWVAKDESLEVDLAARKGLLNDFPTTSTRDLDRIMSSFDELVFDGGHFLTIIVPNPGLRRKVSRAPARFPATALLSAYATLNAVSATFADVGYGRHSRVLRAPSRRNRGAWVDARIATASARADVLVTDDQHQRNCVNFVAARYALRVRALSTEEWIAAA